MSEIEAAYALAALDEWPQERCDWLDAHGLLADALARIGVERFAPINSETSPYRIAKLA